MGKTGIEWTGRTWNPVRGCTRVSEGCRNCYAERQAIRMSGRGQAYEGLVKSTPNGPRWTGKVRMALDHLHDPLAWQKPGMVFVNSMSDLFHEGLNNTQIAEVMGIILASERQTHQVLTKRAERLPEWFQWLLDVSREQGWSWSTYLLSMAAQALGRAGQPVWESHLYELSRHTFVWPIRNLWILTSVEDQPTADERIPHLLRTPAAVRGISYEPALGPIDLDPPTCQNGCDEHLGREVTLGTDGATPFCGHCDTEMGSNSWLDADGLDWVIVGAESGHGARPMQEEWVRDVRDQCARSGTKFFYKQRVEGRKKVSLPMLDGRQWAEVPR